MTVTAERWPEQARRILFAYDPGPHSALAADLAGAFGRIEHAQVRAVHVVPRAVSDIGLTQVQQKITQSLSERLPQAEFKVVRGGDIVTALLRESKDTDLIITGSMKPECSNNSSAIRRR